MPSARVPDPPPSWPANAKGRLMVTMALVVSERGYSATRVSDVLERTRISRRTFYVHFTNREDCFFATYDAIVADLSRLLAADHADIKEALARLLDYFTTWPAHARVLLIEVLAAGPAGAERHEETIATMASKLAACEPSHPRRCRILGRSDVAQASVGAMLRLVQLGLVTEGGDALPKLLPALVALATLTAAAP